MPGRDGQEGKFTPIVGRDGHLSIAQRYDSYRGIAADVVREHDTFIIEHDIDPSHPEPTPPRITHRYEVAGAPQRVQTQTEGGTEEKVDEALEVKLRGRIIAAWALVYREGRAPAYFYAPWDEYAPKERRKAWRTHPSAMIRKSAVVNALREAFSLSGLYFEGEMDVVAEASSAPHQPDEPSWGEDPKVAVRVRQLVDAVNAVRPGAFRPAKLRLALRDKTDEDRLDFCRELERELEARGQEIPPLDVDAEEEPEDARGDDGEAVVDAEVVEGEDGPEAGAEDRSEDLDDEQRASLSNEVDRIDQALEAGEVLDGFSDVDAMETRRGEILGRLGVA
jgi:hypothetical protein